MLARFLSLVVIVIVFAGAPAAELEINGGFEQSAADAAAPRLWQCDREVYSLDRTQKRSGSASLRYQNADPKVYRLASQKVPLQPGRKYRFTAWVRTAAVAGPESGATVCLEWQDKDSKWLGGSYPAGVKGTADWRQVEGIVRIPKEAGAVNLSCYVRNGMTGTAWFDDVEIQRLVDPPMRTVLLSPNYRGRITGAGPAQTCVRVHLDLADYDMKLEQMTLGWRLFAPGGALRAGRGGFTPSRTAGVPTDLVIPLPPLAPGSYDLAIQLLAPGGKVLQEAHHAIERVRDDFKPVCQIDPHGRLIVEGKPFLPLGMYWSTINEDDLKVYADSAFNCLMPYGSPNEEQMDLAHRHGMKVIYSVKDYFAGSAHAPGFIKTEEDEKTSVLDRVQRFRRHPALLAWYLNDELPQTYLARLEAHQQWVAQADPDHPTWVVLYQFREVAAYINTFDVIGTDPYPIGRAPASEAAAWTAETRRQVEGARPLWQVPQVHNWLNYRKDDGKSGAYHTPTYDEIRSMAWQCLCEGATGLVFYSWYDLKRNPDVPFDRKWRELKQVVAEIDRFAPILLSIQEQPALGLKVHGGSPERPQDAPPWLHSAVRRHEGKIYVFAVNDGDGAGQVGFQLSPAATGRPAATPAWKPAGVRELAAQRAVNLAQNGFVDQFEPLAVHVYEITCTAE